MQLKDYHLFGTFAQRSYRKALVYALMRNFLLNIALQQELKQANTCVYQKLCIFVAFTQVSKLGLHPEMLSSLSCIIKLLKITIKMKTGLLMYVLTFYIYIYMFKTLLHFIFYIAIENI